MKNNWELVPEQVTQAIDKSWLNENTFLTVCSVQFVTREFKQIATATSTAAVVDAVSWGEYVS